MLGLVLVATLAAPHLDAGQWIEAKQAIERARYAFVIGSAKPPFDEAYPRSFFEKLHAAGRERERVLQHVFAVAITARMLDDELGRIERDTKAPEQWSAMKAAVHDDRQLLEDVICRPLLVDRILRQKFAFDENIQARRHDEARRARIALMKGRIPASAIDVHIDPDALEPAAMAALSKELKKSGDVSTILEFHDRFEVYKLIRVEAGKSWRAHLVRISKENFDTWYEQARTR